MRGQTGAGEPALAETPEGMGQPERGALERAAQERDYLLAHVRCLLWRAVVTEVNGELVWQFSYANEEAAWRYFRLRDPGLLPDGSRSLAAALRRSRVPEDRKRMRAHAWQRFHANESYDQDFRVYARAEDSALEGEERGSGAAQAPQEEGPILWLRERVEVRPIGPGRWEALGVTVDVTEQRLLEEERVAREREVAAVRARALSEYFSVASHELRTPITTLSGYCQLLLRRFERDHAMDRDALASVLRAVERQSSRLTRLIGHLLDADRLEHGRLRLERAWTDVGALVTRVADEISLQLGETPILVTLEAKHSLGAVVDPLRLEQVVVNLLDNAVRHGGAGRTVDVTVEALPGGVRFGVRDRGPGIPRADRELVFERFRQVRPESYVSGLGLGLFVSREIVELHGGRLHIEEPEDDEGGVRFVIWLPADVEMAARVDDVQLRSDDA